MTAVDLEPGFKMTELGPLPEEWEVLPFEQSIIKKRIHVAKIKQQDYLSFGKVRVVDQGQEIVAGYCNKTEGSYSDELPVIVFGDHTRIFKYVDFPFIVGADGVKILTPDRNLFDPLFLYFELSNLNIPSRGYNRHYRLLREKFISRPPLPEQRAIAHVLRTVQRAREATEAVIEAAKKVKRSLMRHLLTYGAVPVDQADQVKLKDTEIGPVPEEWDVVTLGKIFKLTSGKSRPTSVKDSPQDNYPFAIYGGNGILGYSSEYFLEKSTIVLGRVGAYCGAIHVSKPKSWISDNALYVKQMLRKDVDLHFLAHLLHYMNLNQYKNRGGQPLISQSIVYSREIGLPPLPEQHKIAEILSSLDRKIETEQARKAALDRLFKSLLANLMTGKIRVKVGK